jgi:hypothetical protein
MVLKISLVRGTWIYVIPVSGLHLTKEINEEIAIERVTFITVRKLARVRKKFGLPKPISKLRLRYSMVEFLSDESQVVAVFRHTGKPQEIEAIVRKNVTEALWLFSASQLGFKKRRNSSFPVVGATTARRFVQLCINADGSGGIVSGRREGKFQDLVTNEFWVAFKREMFFGNLLRILHGHIKVADSWRDTLRRVALLVGQSQSSSDIAQAFLLNMIAIETLLMEQQDKPKDALPERVEAFIGWIGYWHTSHYEERLRGAYTKRCRYVHNGAFDEIQIKDLLFMDDILLNILVNILGHPDVFPSKRSVIEFSQKVSAAKILDLHSRMPGVRPKTLMHVSRNYSDADLAQI